MKLLGAALILLSSLFLGVRSAGELKKREALLLDLKRAIQAFRTGVSFSAKPLGELVRENRNSQFCALAVKNPSFFTDPKAALEQAGEKLLKLPSDLELYKSFVRGLGESDTQGQLEHFSLFSALLETNLAAAREETQNRSRLCVCLGLFGGIALCLVLL